MARRAASESEDDSSQKENRGVPMKVKPEKGVKPEKKPSVTKAEPTRVASASGRAQEDDDNAEAAMDGADAAVDDEREEQEEDAPEVNGADHEDNSDADEDADAEGSPRGAKRARVNEEGDSVNVKDEVKGKSKAKARGVMLERDVDKCVLRVCDASKNLTHVLCAATCPARSYA